MTHKRTTEILVACGPPGRKLRGGVQIVWLQHQSADEPARSAGTLGGTFLAGIHAEHRSSPLTQEARRRCPKTSITTETFAAAVVVGYGCAGERGSSPQRRRNIQPHVHRCCTPTRSERDLATFTLVLSLPAATNVEAENIKEASLSV